jgi:uncharacterized protein
MNWQDLGVALALFLVLEGVMPFLSPQHVRRLFERLTALHDTQLRFIGLSCMLAGLVLLYALRG